MGVREGDAQVFIVRIWQEPREVVGADPITRGSVEHVASGTRRYVNQLDEITPFMATFVHASFQRRRVRLLNWLRRPSR